MKLAQNNGNDRVYTPPALAKAIVNHFKPSGWLCDPCAGKRAFANELEKFSDNVWIEEIDDTGVSFLDVDLMFHMDWIVTNPPWSKLRPFLQKSMKVADNVVFLCLTNALFYNGRQDDIKKAGFGLREIARVRQPKKPWPQTGFMLSANLLQRGWEGPCQMTEINWLEETWV